MANIVSAEDILGVYPVGSECIKKIPAEYRYAFANNGKASA